MRADAAAGSAGQEAGCEAAALLLEQGGLEAGPHMGDCSARRAFRGPALRAGGALPTDIAQSPGENRQSQK